MKKESGVPHLLQMGNEKLGVAIHQWSIPAQITCPGCTECWRTACYALRGRYVFSKVREKLQWCYEQCQRENFVTRMADEIRRSGVLSLRIHCSGDFWSRQYAEAWLTIMKQFPRVRFYGYTRSWRVPKIAGVLEQMAALRCCRLWYSVDSETGLPERVPLGVRLAYLQIRKDEQPEQADLVFRVRKLRKEASLPIICGAETSEGKADGTNCGSCQRCFR